ncbi:Na+/H+ antiporter subunit E [Myxococcota bacterium]|jgi:multicomponent Na+:H+ antiporter subunit E|nr:Na+/H+ antiporter subunit E [Myxococcota bacterium]MBU1413101.1 Na+/H+ antiporter subunit E [Myxococcota bacterium]MBU1512258.1 Na+/H+ antiporter subunit E [Myxococcota bacterium]PKN27069.1 MAG: Na+/H+ antiporter subunit D [Deltaproteobacteria bacterium HGW-Deltaproteobacteria-22]
MRAWLSVFFAAWVLWLALTVPWQPLQILAGALVAAIAAFFVRPLLPASFSGFGPVVIGRFLLFVPVFIVEMVKANFQIAWIVLHPRMPMNPRVLTAKTRLESDAGKMLLANAITLTPGTLTIDARGDELIIHCVSPTPEQEQDPNLLLSPFEDHIRRFAP